MKWEKRDSSTSIQEVFLRNMGVHSLQNVNEWCLKSQKNNYRIDKLKDAVELLKAHKDEHITIVGDYDADGCTSTAILYLGLREYGFKNVSYRIPRRYTEGYGINEAIIDEIDSGVILTCDNGIAAIDAIKKAKEKGLTVIVTDHHEHAVDENGSPVYPAADIIIDPAAIPGSADFTGYCGAGLAYRLISELFDNKPEIKNKYVGLAAIGTVGDVMRIHEENYVIVRQGLKTLKMPSLTTSGLYALLNESNCLANLTSTDLAFTIAPVLNALSRLKDEGGKDQLQLLTFNGPAIEAKKYAQAAIGINGTRKALEKELLAKANAMILDKKYSGLCPLVINIPNANEGLIGICAGNLAEKYRRPAMVFTNVTASDGTTMLKGSVRGYGDYDVKAALDKHSDLIFKYGGHTGAAGLTIEEEKLIPLAKALNQDLVGYQPPEGSHLLYDLEIQAKDMGKTIEELKKYEPFGEGNPAPVFKIVGFRPMMKNGEYRRKLGTGGIKINGFGGCAINFANSYEAFSNVSESAELNFIGTLSDNVFRNTVTHQITFQDFNLYQK